MKHAAIIAAPGCDPVSKYAEAETAGGQKVYLVEQEYSYSGRGRSSFDIEQWGYPGYDPFVPGASENKTHVFLFSETATYEWKDWHLQLRDPEKEYRSYLDF